MLETIQQDEKQINLLSAHKKQALILYGYLDADEDYYQAKRNKIIVMSTKSESKTKGADNMTIRKHCYKRADGRWQYSKQQNGFLSYAIASTYRELLEKIPKIQPRPLKTIKHKTLKTTQNTFLQYYQFYIDNYIKNKKITQDTLTDWQRQLNKDLTPVFKYVKLQDVTTEMLQNFIDSINKERKQETLYQRIVKVMQKAYATGRIKRDVTLGIEKPKRHHKQKRHPLTLDQQKRLLQKIAGSKIETFVVFSLIVGSRREETMHFNLDTDLDRINKEIHIKGTKTENADRYVKVTQQFIDYLNKKMSKPYFDFNIYYPTKVLSQMYKELNIKDACLHTLRHTCSANLYFLGATDKYRQMQLGHASIVTTNDIYTNIRENISKVDLSELYKGLYPEFD